MGPGNDIHISTDCSLRTPHARKRYDVIMTCSSINKLCGLNYTYVIITARVCTVDNLTLIVVSVAL